MNTINIRKLLRLTYLKLYRDGLKQISLKEEDLEKYLPKLEKIANDYDIDDKDLFIKKPITESHTNYIAFLIETFAATGTGYLNNKYDSIILNYKKQLIDEELSENSLYDFLIAECSNTIKGTENRNGKKQIKMISPLIANML